MSLDEALTTLLTAYHGYYDVNRESPLPPFAAEAEFHQHDERYFLMRSAKLSESDSRETVYFALEEELSLERAHALAETAWQDGLKRYTPEWNHRGADVILIVLTGRLSADAAKGIPKIRRGKSYALSLKGWSNFRLIAFDVHSGAMAYNRLGQPLTDVLRNTLCKKGNGQ
ncbi:MAG: hypothetical protein IKE30_02260 [Clostridia bacterium]|nr:hypothetical protein [Clostridia bacterium]